jgi:aspartate carbamoyltransferase catalytic subunit
MQKHLFSIQQLSSHDILHILATAKDFQANIAKPLLQKKWVANLFFEPSTRTRCSFEMAAKQLGAEVLNIDIPYSSTQKGETILDTVKTLEAMGCVLFVVRHAENGMSQYIANHLKTASVVNAGDGQNEHPTQALLDMLTISQYKPNFSELSVAIVGDIVHSRVARSDIFALQTLGVKQIRVIAPSTLLPDKDFLMSHKGVSIQVFEDLYEGLQAVDVIMALRVQKERMSDIFNMEAFSQTYCITEEALKQAKPNVIVMHPGPLNREVEVTSAVADGEHSVILQQVKNGVAVRMAVFEFLKLSSTGA